MEIINEKNFDEKIANGVVLVDFFANWCGPCKMIAPVLEKLSEKYNGQMSFYKVDCDQSQAICMRYGIQSIPTLIIFKDGQVAKQSVGFMGAPQVEALIKAQL